MAKVIDFKLLIVPGLLDSDSVGSNAWWLGARGATFADRAVLFFLKAVFRGTRFSLKVLLGRKKRDELFAKKNINFRDFLYRAIEPFGPGRLSLEIAVPKHGYKIHCPLNKEDFIVMTKHEDEMLDLFAPELGDIVVDVGAHMGRYTIPSARRVGEYGRVVAIEAHPGNFRLLDHNIKLNRLDNVTALNFAVFSKKELLKLYLPDESRGYTMHHSVMAGYLATKYSNAGEYVQVQAETLDSLLAAAGVSRVNWVKIDVEGAELEVLKGAEKTLSENGDIALLVEIHGKETYVPVMGLLRSHGFKAEFEKTYDNGEKHVIARKSASR